MTDNIIKMVIIAIVFIILGLAVLSLVGFFGGNPWSPIMTHGDTVSLDIPQGEAGGTAVLDVPPTSAVPEFYSPFHFRIPGYIEGVGIAGVPEVTPTNAVVKVTPTNAVVKVTPTNAVIEVTPTSAVPEYDSLFMVLILTGIIGVFVIGKKDIR